MTALLDILRDAAPYLAALAGIVLAALANGMETGIYRVNRIRLRLRAEAGHRRARALTRLLRDLRGVIIVCLIGYNGGAYLTTAVVTRLVARSGWAEGDLGVEVLTTAILAPLFFVLTDVTPKSILTYEADRWMYRLTPLLGAAYAFFQSVLLVPALKGISTLVLRIAHRSDGGANPFQPRQRLRALLREGAAEGVITGYQDELIEKVLGLRDRQVRQAMIPVGRVVSVAAGTRQAEFLEELRRHPYSRFPVYEGRRENIVGIVHIRDVLGAEDPSVELGAVMSRDFLSLDPDMPVGQAMFRMQRRRAAMAVIRDRDGPAQGIVTIKDLVEEIVGELSVW